MLLAIDAGNTDIVFGLYDGRDWMHLWRIPSGEPLSQEACTFRLVSELLELDLKPDDLKNSVISSVVPAFNRPLSDMLFQLSGHRPLVLGPELYPKLKIQVLNPEELGTDLVANAVAAFDRFNGKCVVVDFGTALTFTTISETGEILGVAIAPGLKTALHSLFQDTAQLPEVPLVVPASALGKNTVHAIQAGIGLGYTGLVKFLLAHIKKEIGEDCRVIATGGLSSVFPSLRDSFDEVDRLLTLKGLAIISLQ